MQKRATQHLIYKLKTKQCLHKTSHITHPTYFLHYVHTCTSYTSTMYIYQSLHARQVKTTTSFWCICLSSTECLISYVSYILCAKYTITERTTCRDENFHSFYYYHCYTQKMLLLLQNCHFDFCPLHIFLLKTSIFLTETSQKTSSQVHIQM